MEKILHANRQTGITMNTVAAKQDCAQPDQRLSEILKGTIGRGSDCNEMFFEYLYAIGPLAGLEHFETFDKLRALIVFEARSERSLRFFSVKLRAAKLELFHLFSAIALERLEKITTYGRFPQLQNSAKLLLSFRRKYDSVLALGCNCDVELEGKFVQFQKAGELELCFLAALRMKNQNSRSSSMVQLYQLYKDSGDLFSAEFITHYFEESKESTYCDYTFCELGMAFLKAGNVAKGMQVAARIHRVAIKNRFKGFGLQEVLAGVCKGQLGDENIYTLIGQGKVVKLHLLLKRFYPELEHGKDLCFVNLAMTLSSLQEHEKAALVVTYIEDEEIRRKTHLKVFMGKSRSKL